MTIVVINHGNSPIGIGARVVLTTSGSPQATNFSTGYIDDLLVSRLIALSSSSTGTIPLGPNGQAVVPIIPTAPLQPAEPDGILPENADWSKHFFVLNIRVYGPASPPDDPVLDADEEFIQARRHNIQMMEQQFSDGFHRVEALLKAGVRAALALDDLSYLAHLGSSGEIDFKKTTFAICNVAFTYATLLSEERHPLRWQEFIERQSFLRG